MNKQSVLILWFVLVALMLLASGWLASIGKFVFWLLVVVHIAEFFVKKDVLEKAGGSMGKHFVQTLIYGMFHWQPLEEAQQGSSED